MVDSCGNRCSIVADVSLTDKSGFDFALRSRAGQLIAEVYESGWSRFLSHSFV